MPLTPIDLLLLPGNTLPPRPLPSNSVTLDAVNGNEIELNGPRGALLIFSGTGEVILTGAVGAIGGARNTATFVLVAGVPIICGPFNPFFWAFSRFAIKVQGPATASVAAYAY